MNLLSRRQLAPLHARQIVDRPGGDSGRRADIEGLRAVAVVLVVLFHASIGGLPGGFIGVDVFFVVSGFLITGLLLREVGTTGSISLPAFYARRARRLLPAALLVLLVTLGLSALVLPPLLVPGVATDTAAAALYVSNMGFAAQATDYFAATQAPSPILHYWSLGVEEQFYLFWPAILLLVARRPARRELRVAVTIVAISVVSFGLAYWLTTVAEPWAFFSLPTRAWELGLGAILAVAGRRLVRVPGPIAAAGGWVGLALIVYAGATLDQATPFPGTAALMPTLGAALVLVSGVRPAAWGPAGLLGSAVPRFLGRISYSLYLWHWPLLVLPAVAADVPLPLGERALLVLLAIFLAAVTQRLLEDPLRRGRIIGTLPRRNLAMAGAFTLAVAIAATATGTEAQARLASGTDGGGPTAAQSATDQHALDAILNQLESAAPSPSTTSKPAPTGAAASHAPAAAPAPTPRPATKDRPLPASLRPSLWAAQNDYPLSYLDGCHTQMDGHPNRGSCLYGDLKSSTTIVLFGDSHALAWFPAVKAVADREGWRLLSLTMSTCSPADIPIWVPAYDRVSTECSAWRVAAINRIAQEHPAIVLVAGTRGFATVNPAGQVLTGDARLKEWRQGIQRTLTRLVATAGHVIFMADTPASDVDPAVCLSAHPSSTLACATPVDQALNAAWTGQERAVAAATGAGFIDGDLWVCPSSPCPAVIGNFLVYRDAGHMSATFSAALGDRLDAAILEQVERPQPMTAR